MSDRFLTPSLSGLGTVTSHLPSLQYEVRKAEGVTEILLIGSMTFADHVAFREILTVFDGPSGYQIVFNLKNLQFVDSAGLGMFLIADESAKKKSLDFRIVSPQDQVHKIIELGKFNQIIDIRQ